MAHVVAGIAVLAGGLSLARNVLKRKRQNRQRRLAANEEEAGRSPLDKVPVFAAIAVGAAAVALAAKCLKDRREKDGGGRRIREIQRENGKARQEKKEIGQDGEDSKKLQLQPLHWMDHEIELTDTGAEGPTHEVSPETKDSIADISEEAVTSNKQPVEDEDVLVEERRNGDAHDRDEASSMVPDIRIEGDDVSRAEEQAAGGDRPNGDKREQEQGPKPVPYGEGIEQDEEGEAGREPTREAKVDILGEVAKLAEEKRQGGEEKGVGMDNGEAKLGSAAEEVRPEGVANKGEEVARKGEEGTEKKVWDEGKGEVSHEEVGVGVESKGVMQQGGRKGRENGTLEKEKEIVRKGLIVVEDKEGEGSNMETEGQEATTHKRDTEKDNESAMTLPQLAISVVQGESKGSGGEEEGGDWVKVETVGRKARKEVEEEEVGMSEAELGLGFYAPLTQVEVKEAGAEVSVGEEEVAEVGKGEEREGGEQGEKQEQKVECTGGQGAEKDVEVDEVVRALGSGTEGGSDAHQASDVGRGAEVEMNEEAVGAGGAAVKEEQQKATEDKEELAEEEVRESGTRLGFGLYTALTEAEVMEAQKGVVGEEEVGMVIQVEEPVAENRKRGEGTDDEWANVKAAKDAMDDVEDTRADVGTNPTDMDNAPVHADARMGPDMKDGGVAREMEEDAAAVEVAEADVAEAGKDEVAAGEAEEDAAAVEVAEADLAEGGKDEVAAGEMEEDAAAVEVAEADVAVAGKDEVAAGETEEDAEAMEVAAADVAVAGKDEVAAGETEEDSAAVEVAEADVAEAGKDEVAAGETEEDAAAVEVAEADVAEAGKDEVAAGEAEEDAAAVEVAEADLAEGGKDEVAARETEEDAAAVEVAEADVVVAGKDEVAAGETEEDAEAMEVAEADVAVAGKDEVAAGEMEEDAAAVEVAEADVAVAGKDEVAAGETEEDAAAMEVAKADVAVAGKDEVAAGETEEDAAVVEVAEADVAEAGKDKVAAGETEEDAAAVEVAEADVAVAGKDEVAAGEAEEDAAAVEVAEADVAVAGKDEVVAEQLVEDAAAVEVAEADVAEAGKDEATEDEVAAGDTDEDGAAVEVAEADVAVAGKDEVVVGGREEDVERVPQAQDDLEEAKNVLVVAGGTGDVAAGSTLVQDDVEIAKGDAGRVEDARCNGNNVADARQARRPNDVGFRTEEGHTNGFPEPSASDTACPDQPSSQGPEGPDTASPVQPDSPALWDSLPGASRTPSVGLQQLLVAVPEKRNESVVSKKPAYSEMVKTPRVIVMNRHSLLGAHSPGSGQSPFNTAPNSPFYGSSPISQGSEDSDYHEGLDEFNLEVTDAEGRNGRDNAQGNGFVQGAAVEEEGKVSWEETAKEGEEADGKHNEKEILMGKGCGREDLKEKENSVKGNGAVAPSAVFPSDAEEPVDCIR